MSCLAPPLSVTVANGSRVLSKTAWLGFCWTMQGETFEADLRLLKLGGCQIVLGVDWMREISSISFDDGGYIGKGRQENHPTRECGNRGMQVD